MIPGFNKWSVLAVMIATAILIGTLDYVTGSEASVALLYLLPISVVTWFVGLRAGLFICLLCAAARLPEVWTSSHGFSHALTPYWNTLFELGFFLFVAVILSKLRFMMEREAKLARTDSLTGAFNRRAFVEIATRELARAERYQRPILLAYFDVDDFKKVNDAGGHAAGDLLLMTVGEVLRDNLRSCDVVARYGGDEFLMLLPETGDEAAGAVLGKVMAALRTAMTRWQASLSVGAIAIEAPRASIEQLIMQADHLAYAAKQAGKNHVRYLHLAPDGRGPREALPAVSAVSPIPRDTADASMGPE